VLWLGRRFDEALAEAEGVLAVDPRHATGLIRLGAARAAKGQYEAAAGAFRTARDATPGLLDCRSLLGYACALAGERDGALAELRTLSDLAARRYVPPFLFANIHLGLGDHDTALKLIEEEYQHRGWYLLLTKQSPIYDPLRGNRRFQALLGRMNFPV
jgi:Flp pilus assembly protein TadD